MLIAFVSSFIANPFMGFNVFVGLSGILIWYVFLADLFSPNNFKSFIPKKVYLIIIFIAFYGILLGILNTGSHLSPGKVSNTYQLINVTIYILTIAAFLKISGNSFAIPEYRYKIIKFFTFSAFIQLLSFFLIHYSSSDFIPEFLRGSNVVADEVDKQLYGIDRFSGLIGDYELIVDYAIIVIFFNLMLIQREKRWLVPVLSMTSAIIIASLSGTRSFYVVLLVIFVLIVLLSLIYSAINKRILKIGIIISVVFLLIYYFVLKDLVIFERLEFAIELYKGGAGIEEASNRNLTAGIPEIISTVPLTGSGSFFFFALKNNPMVSHNLLFALYVKYGILGVGTFLLFVGSLFFNLLKKLRNERIINNKIEIIYILSFFAGLFLQEMKISALRYFQTMLVYAIFFLFIYAHIKSKNDSSEQVIKKRILQKENNNVTYF